MPHSNRAHSKFSHFLSEAVILEDGIVARNYRLFLLATIVVGIIFLITSGLRPIDEAVKTTGQFIPRSFVRTIQASEGGIIAKLYVRDGDMVEEGGMLIQIKNTYTVSEREQMHAKLAGLIARAARLKAYINETVPDFSELDLAKYQDIYKDQISLLRTLNQVRQTSLWVVQTQISQKKAEVNILEEQLNNAKKREGVNSTLLALREDLAKKNLVSRIAQLGSKREHLNSEGEIQRLTKQLEKSRSSLDEVEQRYTSMVADFRSQASIELGSVQNEIEQVKKGLAKLDDRARQMDVLAPVKGRVQELRVRTPGSVVMNGDPLLDIVPVEDLLHLEVKITPKDIGFIKPGQQVVIKVSSYDYALFGTVPGTLESISPFTFMDADKKVYYRGIVQPSSYKLTKGDHNYPLLPGMHAQADIVTGHRLLVSYLFKPLLFSHNNRGNQPL
ncbi:MAG: HlyD family type I secretion periplasmic adaptor subunit [Magnetococcales bacterium]|nr:HlyD family type I secretion periplasmic adaptor subunit [Magnetococcales bacterium]NGZ26709.1 HlyD family type I secretion periplasmic adaptor subunit [Magnetococcales bacterium]